MVQKYQPAESQGNNLHAIFLLTVNHLEDFLQKEKTGYFHQKEGNYVAVRLEDTYYLLIFEPANISERFYDIERGKKIAHYTITEKETKTTKSFSDGEIFRHAKKILYKGSLMTPEQAKKVLEKISIENENP